MVKFNFWESLGHLGKHPKRFKRDARKQIENNTLEYLKRFGRAKWIPVPEIFEQTLEQTDLFNSKEGRMWFAFQGIKSKISSATHKLRRDGYPIISGRGHRGYRYADENCDDFIDVWDEKFSAWEKRKTKLDKEKNRDGILINKIIEKLKEKKRFEEAKQLEKVLIKYSEKEE